MMKFLLILGSIAIPVLMILIRRILPKLHQVYNVIAIISILVFGNISSLAIHRIIKDQTVFMTNIHSLFLNPLFLLTGSYMGLYVIYRMVILTLDEL